MGEVLKNEQDAGGEIQVFVVLGNLRASQLSPSDLKGHTQKMESGGEV